tara:strand:- start:893 stop:1018 length:126 start_codon:yes stop_codon:yes gene_type:complete
MKSWEGVLIALAVAVGFYLIATTNDVDRPRGGPDSAIINGR